MPYAPPPLALTHTCLKWIVRAIALLFLSTALTVAAPSTSDSQQPTVPVCVDGMLTPDLTSCWVPASTSPAEFTRQTETVRPDPATGLCSLGYETILTNFDLSASCERQILTLQPRTHFCSDATLVHVAPAAACYHDEPPIQMPCVMDPAGLTDRSCEPDVTIWDCSSGFASIDGELCFANNLEELSQPPTERIESYSASGGCVVGYMGPDSNGQCIRTVLTAQPNVPTCTAGVLTDIGNGFRCLADETPTSVRCSEEPILVELGPCAIGAGLSEAPAPAPVAACSAGGLPSLDAQQCYSFGLVNVTLPGGSSPTVSCTAGTPIEFGPDVICLLDETPTSIGCDGALATVDLRLGQSPTQGDDVIVGTPGDDVISGFGGNDIICGGGGNDKIWGGEGNDRIFGQGGDDFLRGGPGDDALVGDLGNDDLAGGPGDDQVWGGPGDDPIVRGGTGDDIVDGGRGDDALVNGNGGSDRVTGGHGSDRVRGGPRPDLVAGGSGDDDVKGNKGADQLWGGFGADQVHGGPQPDDLFGGAGYDRCNGGITLVDPAAPESDRATGCESTVYVP